MTSGQPRPLADSDPRFLGRFKVLGLLGEGGMGRVFLGSSPGGWVVAIKVIHAGLAADPAFRARFAHEVAMARAVGGFYTAPVVDADTDAERPWLAVAYVAGPSLAEAVVAGGAFPLPAVLRLGLGLGEALQAIHAAGIVHRDLKPSNVLLAADGPRVIDFGIARAAEHSSLTRTGTILGSAGFMAPEQITGEHTGPAADVFALGAVLTFAATGQGPFGEGRTEALAYRVVHVEPALAGLPDPLRGIVGRCLAKDPGQRPSPGEIITALAATPVTTPGTGESWLPSPVEHLVGLHHAAMTALPTPTPAPNQAPTQVPNQAQAQVPTPTPTPTPTPQTPSPESAAPTMTALGSGSPQPVTPVPTPAPAAPPPQWRPASPQQGPYPGPAPQQWGPVPSQRRPTRRRPPGWVFGVVALVVVLAVAGVVAASRLSARNSVPSAGLTAGSSTTASSAASPATPTQSVPPSPPGTGSGGPAAVSSPAGVVQAYYAAINNHDCNAAWKLGGNNISAARGQSYQQFCQGFSNTSHDSLTVDSVAGNTVNVTIVAQQTDGSSQTFTGSYAVSNGVIDSASIQSG